MQRTLLIALLLLGTAAIDCTRAQDEQSRPLNEQVLSTLHRVGLPASEILAAIENRGLSDALDAAAVERMRKDGMPKAVLQRVERDIEGRGAVQITVADIETMHRAGIAIPVIRERIVASPGPIEHDAEDIIRMAGAGVPEALIRAMREHDPSRSPALERDTGQLSLDDLIAMARTGMNRDQILERIRRADARFEVVPDDLIRLSQAGVSQEVVTEVWARREVAAQPTIASAAPSGERPASAQAKTAELGKLLVHREPAGSFTLVVPAGFTASRQNANGGRNQLLSLMDGEPDEDTPLADTELQILRVRARENEVERLIPANLDNIGNNFVSRLQANYASKQIKLTPSTPYPIEISGLPGVLYRLASSASDGTTHEGEMAVVIRGDEVVVISYAIRADLFTDRAPVMAAALRSLTFETERPEIELAAEPRKQLRILFETWKAAIQSNDYGLLRQLLPELGDTADRRVAFIDQVEKLDRPQLKLQLGSFEIDEAAGIAKVHCRVIGPKSAETVVIPFQRTQRGFRLQ